MGQGSAASGGEDDFGPLVGRIGEIRWRITLPRNSYAAYRRGLGLAIAPFARQARNWLLKRFLIAAPLLVLVEFAALIQWRPYVILYLEGRGFGPYTGGGGALLAVLAFTWCAAFALTVLCSKLKTSHILRNAYEAAAQEDSARELIFGERGLLVASPDTRTVFHWEGARRLVAGQDHWYLVFRVPMVAIAIPADRVAALADGDAFLAFLREKTGTSREGT